MGPIPGFSSRSPSPSHSLPLSGSSRKSSAKNAVKTALILLEKAVDGLPIPGLKGTAGSLVEIIKIAEKAKQNTDALQDLAAQLHRLENAVVTPLLAYQHHQIPPAVQARVERLTGELSKLVSDLQNLKTSHTRWRRYTNHEDYTAAIQDINRTIKESVDAFLVENQVAVAIVAERTQRDVTLVKKHLLSQRITSLPHTDAAFNSISRNDAPTCFQDTRKEVLDDILKWFEDDTSLVHILKGIAGVGKTTIAQTISVIVNQQGRLAASFYFSRYESDRSTSKKFFVSLARQIAQHNSEFAAELDKVLEGSPDAGTETVALQFQKLLVGPLRRMASDTAERMLVVLDALDECDEREGAEVLRLLVDNLSQFPRTFKIFVTTRPEHQFKPILEPSKKHDQLILHDIEEKVVQADIRRYLHHQLSLKEIQKVIYDCDWEIGTEDLETLVQAAGRLFIVASTAEKFIKDTNQGNPPDQLRILLQSIHAGVDPDDSPFATLDQLYSQILNAAIPQARRNTRTIRRFQNVVGTIIALQNPLPPVALAGLVGENLMDVKAVLDLLQSVIVPSGEAQCPHVYHPSFPDFITNPNRCIEEPFLIKTEMHHTRLVVQCLDVMSRLLRKNICDLPVPDRYMKNHRIPDLPVKIEGHIPSELEYACTYWAVHLSKAEFSSEVMMKLEVFFQTHLLSWLEVLSLTGRLEHAYPALVHAQKFLTFNNAPVEFLGMSNDAQRFLLGSYEMIKMSAMHIYYSALPMAPIGSGLFRMYEHWADESVEVLLGRENNWNPALAVLVGHSGWVKSVAFSPDGSRLASASDDKTVRLWDGVTGAVVAELRGHSGWVNSVVFSPNGSRLASASFDNTVRLWDGVTGAVVAELPGHSHSVNSVMFSPNGSRLASASGDKTVRLWDGMTGAVVAELRGHSDSVNSVVFSPNGSRLASASKDNTVRLWDGMTGAVVVELRGHSDWVNSVVFSPNGSRLASASSDKTVRLWDVVTGAVVAELRGHSDWVNSVVFSPDGSRLASASKDNTVRLWDGVTGAVVAELRGHSDWVNSVVFSPDGSRLASASFDKTVRLWDGVTGAVVAELRGHPHVFFSMVFSPNGSRLASASYDNTVRLWDGVTGAVVAELRGHSDSVNSVVFSPNGSRLASASKDNTVRLWDGVTGAVVAELRGHSHVVFSVVFSPNGSRLASASSDKTVRLWDGVTGAVVAELRGHSHWVDSVAFSSNGSRLASASSDNTVRLWDGVTGVFVAQYKSTTILDVFQLHTKLDVPINPTFQANSNILTHNVNKSTTLHNFNNRIQLVQLEFNDQANCHVLSGRWLEADQTFSSVCLCWLPSAGLELGEVAQNGIRTALGLRDGRVFIFSTDRLKLS